MPSHASAAAAGTVHASEGVHIKETPILPPGGMFVIGGCLALIACEPLLESICLLLLVCIGLGNTVRSHLQQPHPRRLLANLLTHVLSRATLPLLCRCPVHPEP